MNSLYDEYKVIRNKTLVGWIGSYGKMATKNIYFCNHYNGTVLYVIPTSLVHISVKCNQALSEYKHSLTFRVRRYVVIATKPVHRLQIRATVHN